MRFRYAFYWVAITAAILAPASQAVPQQVDIKTEVKNVYADALYFSRDGRHLHEIQSVRPGGAEPFARARVLTYDTDTGALKGELDFGIDTSFLSATTDGQIVIISVDRDRKEARAHLLVANIKTGKTEEIPSKWFDAEDHNPYATISGNGRVVAAYSETGTSDGPRVVTLYDWQTKKKIGRQATGFPAGGFSWGEVTEDGKILFQTNRTGGEVVDPKTGQTLARVSPNTYRSPDGAWDVDFPNAMYDGYQEATISDGVTGIMVGKLEGSGGQDQLHWAWGRGAFCGTAGRFIAARAGVVQAFEIPSGKKIADFPVETWQGKLPPDSDAGAWIGCSPDGKLVAIRSVERLTVHRLP